MKRILRIARSIYNPESISPQNISGTDIQVYRFIKSLSNDIEQDIFTIKNIDFHCNNVKCYSPKFLGIEIFSLNFSCIKHLRENKNKYDAVQIHASSELFPLIIGEIISCVYKIPVVYTFHCCRNVTYRGKKIEIITNPIVNYLEKRCIRHATHNVFLSNHVVQKLLEKKVLLNTDKVSIIGDAIQIDNIAIPEETKTHDANHKVEILYVGRISHEKGWDIFVECARKLQDKDYIFKMYGPGPDTKKLKEKMEQYKLNNLEYHGFIPNEEVLPILSKADIIVIPSYYEELGSVVLEAGLAKKTVIASSTGALTEILSEGRGYTVPVGDVDGFCSNIVNITESNNYSSGQLLYDYICKHYSMTNVTNKYMDIYNNI
ncbi:MAG: glycosyltransferase family 4 protein [Clostridia bacterium]|nr:glycosyltransferase family 4 protein [Clostridia bacterium]MBQ7046577.1 glycosyltransferase family 4 protein [Oscillospiraceae bacterium]